eukprot:320411-Ditylum_brightwellii.AAC.1
MSSSRIRILTSALKEKKGITNSAKTALSIDILDMFDVHERPSVWPTHIIIDGGVPASSAAAAMGFDSASRMARVFREVRNLTILAQAFC